MGVLDILNLIIFCMSDGVLTMIGAVYCSSPILLYVKGGIICSTIFCLILVKKSADFIQIRIYSLRPKRKS